LAAGLLAGRLWADTPPPAMTLPQALELAERAHPRLRAGAAQIEAASAGLVTAKARPNPEASAAAGYQSYRVPGNVRGPVTNYGVSQALELGELRPARLRLAESGRAVSERQLALTRLEVLTGVRRAFYEALRRRAEIAILDDTARLVEQLRQKIAVRVEVGDAARLELVRAEAEVVAARTAANRARLGLITAFAELQAAVGSTLDPEIVVEGALDAPVKLPPLDELRREVLDRHPALQQAQAEVRLAEARLQFERAQARPQPTVRTDIDVPPDSPTYRVGVSIPLPFQNRRQGPIAEAAALTKQANALAGHRQLLLLTAIDSAHGRYLQATQQLEAFETGLLQEAEAALTAAETAYRLGERGILEVLDAQRVLRTVRLDWLNAQYDRQAALVDLDELRAVEPGGKRDSQ